MSSKNKWTILFSILFYSPQPSLGNLECAIDLNSPIHLLGAFATGYGPFLDLKPSVRYLNKSRYFVEAFANYGVMTYNSFNYFTPIQSDSAAENGPNLVGVGYGAALNLGKIIY